MTEKQIDEIRNELDKKYYGAGIKLECYAKKPISKEDAITYKKLDICEMMLSNLAYGGDYFDMTKEDWYIRNRGKDGYDWDKLEKLGVKNAKKVVEDLWEEMKKDFNEHATIKYGAYTDAEGLSYNSIEWDD